MAKADLRFGYGLAFAGLAALQACLVSLAGVGLLGLQVDGSLALVLLLAVLNAVLGCALGLFASAFAATEFQVAQFMPAFVLPQLLLCGLFVAKDAMVGVRRAISDVLPMTYAYDGLTRAAASSELSGAFSPCSSGRGSPRCRSRRHASPMDRMEPTRQEPRRRVA